MGNKRISEFGVWDQLRVMRSKDGSSLSEVARRAGISLAYLSDLENGHRWPNPTQVKKLALALNCPMALLERTRNTDSEGNSIALRELIREIVREELDARAVA